MFKKFFCSLMMAGLVVVAPSGAFAGTVTATVGLEGFGATVANGGTIGDTGGNGNEGAEYASVTLSLPEIASLDSMVIQLAHQYASDVGIVIEDPNGGSTVVVVGDAAGAWPASPVAGVVYPFGGGHDDNTDLGDGLGYDLANVVDYTLDPTAADPFMDHFGGGVLAAGSYNPDAWVPAGPFPAGDWTVRVWDTWDVFDRGSIGDVSLNYTAIPEPSAIALAVLAMGSVLGLRRRNS